MHKKHNTSSNFELNFSFHTSLFRTNATKQIHKALMISLLKMVTASYITDSK